MENPTPAPQNIDENPVGNSADIASPTPDIDPETPKKRAGRPKGSKNRPKKARKTRAAPVDDSASDPFADAPRPTAAETAAENGDVAPVIENAEPPKQKLGVEGATVAVEMLFSTVRSIDGFVAWQLVKKKAPDIHAAATEAMHLTESEKDTLRPLLILRLAELEVSPDDMLLWAILGIYAGKIAQVGALVDARRTVDVTPGV